MEVSAAPAKNSSYTGSINNNWTGPKTHALDWF